MKLHKADIPLKFLMYLTPSFSHNKKLGIKDGLLAKIIHTHLS